MGLLAIETDHCDHAVDWLARAIGQAAKAEYISALGRALQRLGRLDEAAKAFDKALQLAPHDGDTAERYGTLLLELRRLEEALACFDLCDRLLPNRAPCWKSAAMSCTASVGHDEALADHRRAWALDPDNRHCNNIGASLHSRDLHDDALVWFDLAIALQPGFVMALLNKALSLIQLGRINAALAVLNGAKAIDPDHADVAWNLSLLQLMTGDYESGWIGREARWNGSMRSTSYPAFSQPSGAANGRCGQDHPHRRGRRPWRHPPVRPLPANVGGARRACRAGGQGHAVSAAIRAVRTFAVPAEIRGRSSALRPACPICSLPMAFGTRLDTIPSHSVRRLPHRAACKRGRRGSPAVRAAGYGSGWSGPAIRNTATIATGRFRTGLLSRLLGLDADFISLQKELRPGDATRSRKPISSI